ncbi:hypothetical protein [Cryobacterium sp. Hh38]|uniref:hypothetical protein n=1 Tax=Cryobacterium sp. Hh38 TaxID=1259156 RepID=UPI00106C8230|nr:hypothetical protein [Cryobacterium sp. Hh38]TFD56687.1 hypothetical protein E3T41_16070 [Cryobacterium sp. Hh38]
MGKLGLTATEIGWKIHASAEVVNLLLLEKGLTYGVPGCYGITESGKIFGVERSALKNNSFGTFEWNNWDESVIAELGATPEKIADMTDALKAARAAKRLAGRAEAEDAFVAFMAEKVSHVSDGGSKGSLTAGQKTVIVVVAGVAVIVGGVLIYQGVKRYKRKKAEQVERDEDTAL